MTIDTIIKKVKNNKYSLKGWPQKIIATYKGTDIPIIHKYANREQRRREASPRYMKKLEKLALSA